jgi:hypothetical protein
LELIKVFQFRSKDSSSFNFLFLSFLEEDDLIFLSPNSKEEFLDIKFCNLDQIQNLIDTNQCEHELAKKRLICAVELLKNSQKNLDFMLI